MDAVRVPGRFRMAPLLEWVIAAAFLVATVAVGLARGARAARPAESSRSRRQDGRSSPHCRRGAAPRVSVPMLPFLDGKEIRVGQTAATVAANLGRAAESGRQEVDRGRSGSA